MARHCVAMDTDEPTLTPIKNGWHYGSRVLNLTVRGDTEDDARRLYHEAVRKAAEMRSRPDAVPTPESFANPS